MAVSHFIMGQSAVSGKSTRNEASTDMPDMFKKCYNEALLSERGIPVDKWSTSEVTRRALTGGGRANWARVVGVVTDSDSRGLAIPGGGSGPLVLNRSILSIHGVGHGHDGKAKGTDEGGVLHRERLLRTTSMVVAAVG